MRIIHIDDQIHLNIKELVQEINWSDILEDHVNDIRICIKMLFSIKIIPHNEIIILNKDFKNNMLKIIKSGLTSKVGLVTKKKNKSWRTCFENGMASFEKYLVGIYDLDDYYIESENEKIKFLINSGFIKKEAQNFYKLTPIALTTLLGDKQSQIRTLIIRYILTNKKEDREKNLKFLNFLFSISTLEVGAVK
jgi:hypothetical protein